MLTLPSTNLRMRVREDVGSDTIHWDCAGGVLLHVPVELRHFHLVMHDYHVAAVLNEPRR